MFYSWWWLWFAFMFLCLVPPLGYGWGYRQWGFPYPSYIQRRRWNQANATGGSITGGSFDHYAWGWGGDFVWLVMFIGVIWVCAAMWR